MNVLFNLVYNTSFGEELILNILSGKADGKSPTQYRMSTLDGRVWTYNMKTRLRPGSRLEYYYSVSRGGNDMARCEWKTVPHRLDLNAQKCNSYVVNDRWQDIPDDSYAYSAAFTECLCRHKEADVPPCTFSRIASLKVRAPQLRSGERLVLVGEDKTLGAWDATKGLPMYEHCSNEWVADIDVTQLKSQTFDFKFAAIDTSEHGGTTWEDRYNRTITLPKMEDGVVMAVELENAWFRIPAMRCAGTLVPVFSLRSESSFGVGDFGDLKKMIDWVAMTGQRVLQLLPVNDTTTTHTWTDSYPYSCISIFALHPQYADLTALPDIADEKERTRMEALRTELNALPQIDYERVNAAKDEYLHILFAQEGQKVLRSHDFKAFFDETQEWLVPYAQYCHLRDTTGTSDFTQWKGHTVFDEGEREALSTPKSKEFKEVSYYYYVQFILNTQMAAAHEYARSKGVVLKGDIPIGVNRQGCDVWQEPRYFNLNGQAGAPPDDFSVNGQNWGFPTYNWDEMLKDGCQWWVRRFSNMSKFFDAYRIDHVLGFFRIWEIPVNAVHGLLGQFAPSLGMTREEIEAYGLRFQEELFTEPFITEWVLDRMFGERAGMVRDTYLTPTHDGRFKLKDEFNTQRKIEAAFADRKKQEDIYLRDGLYALVSDVLFVRDRKDSNKFHPRISVQFDYIYESLYDSDKYLFNQIYNDYYYRRNNQFWYQEAMNKLPKLVDATRMLVCAEDLGMVPDCVAWVMKELKILSLELQSMPKDSHLKFGHLEDNPYRSVCTISSHDMPTLRQWWDEDWQRTQDYYTSVMGRYETAPHPLPSWLAREIIARHLGSPSMLCILSIQDWLSIDERIRLADANAERINIPSNPRHYWRYRMHITIEKLIGNREFSANLQDLIRQGERQ